MLVDLYGCTIRHPSDLIDNWQFEIDQNEPELNFDESTEGLTSQDIPPTDELLYLFEIAMTHHINIEGYSQHPQLGPLVDKDEREHQAQSSTIHVCKLLKFASSSELMPQGFWTLTVSNFLPYTCRYLI